jgi:hypothetical protein
VLDPPQFAINSGKFRAIRNRAVPYELTETSLTPRISFDDTRTSVNAYGARRPCDLTIPLFLLAFSPTH